MKTRANNICCILYMLLAILRVPLRANDIDVRVLANLLGYPKSEMVITDVTAQEKEIYSRLTLREEQDNLKPPVDFSRILASYRITGKPPYSFYPILITIATEGAFLSEEFKDLLDKVSAHPLSERLSSGYGYLGPVDYGDAGKGGIMLHEFRVPSPIKEMTYPSQKMGTVSEIRVPKQKSIFVPQ